MLAAVAKYALDPAKLLGDYAGELGNGGGTVILTDPRDNVVDVVKYKDSFPWPIGADALGAGESWLPAEIRPLAQHQYMGRSLERVSFTVSASEVANWAPSPLDGATPGRRNAAAGATPPAIVESIAVAPEGGSGLIRSTHRVQVTVKLSRGGVARDVRLEHFVDNPEVTGEPLASTPLQVTGEAHAVVLPPQPDNTIVRYRISADRGAGREVLSPRPSDPHAWHAYFVSPVVPAASRAYHLFVSRADWTLLWRYIDPGPNSGCTMNPNWQKRVPAVFVHEGKVFDVQVRYQGSRFNRKNGLAFSSWPHPGPSAPSPLRALSWSLKLPRYNRFDGQSEVILNKTWHGCPYFTAYTESRLMEAAGIPAPRIRWARVYVNGGYYKYMADVEPLEEAFIERRTGGQVPGDMFKASGANGDQAVWGRGNGSIIKDLCGFPASARYKETYSRETHDWKTAQAPTDLPQDLVVALQAARAQGVPRLREFLAQHFDVDRTLTYLAVKNWTAPWDDPDHNWVLYRPLGGKWTLHPWDMDLDFGIRWAANLYQTPEVSLYVGEEGDPDNRLGPNYLKDAFFKAYRAEFTQRMKELGRTLLNADAVTKLVDEAFTSFNRTDWSQAPVQGCDPNTSANSLKAFIKARHDVVTSRLGP
jgi:hypothetical protein